MTFPGQGNEIRSRLLLPLSGLKVNDNDVIPEIVEIPALRPSDAIAKAQDIVPEHFFMKSSLAKLQVILDLLLQGKVASTSSSIHWLLVVLR